MARAARPHSSAGFGGIACNQFFIKHG